MFRYLKKANAGQEVNSDKPAKAGAPQKGEAQPAVWLRALGRLPLQARLTVNQPGDIYEQEADRVAAQIMRMPDPAVAGSGGGVRRCACGGIVDETGECPACRAKRLGIQRKVDAAGGTQAPASVYETIGAPGQPLDGGTRGFMEARFGHDFGGVRVHTDGRAAESARAIGAQAYTVGQNVVFGADRYAPATEAGKTLLAHELAHVVQQGQGVRRDVVQRYAGCSSAQDTTVSDDHDRAREMLSNAIAAVSSYDGTNPSKVHDALAQHFNGATSNAFATWINVNLRFLWGTTWMAGYECYTGGIWESTWACRGRDRATTLWCVPGVNIRLCPPYFPRGDIARSTTLIHEWVHKYGCNFDLGYEGEGEYTDNSTLSQLLNAASFAAFIRDVQ